MTLGKLNRKLIIAFSMFSSAAWADSLELRNGSVIDGKFLAGNENEIRFQVGSSVQEYKTADVVSINLDSKDSGADPLRRRAGSETSRP